MSVAAKILVKPINNTLQAIKIAIKESDNKVILFEFNMNQFYFEKHQQKDLKVKLDSLHLIF
jgi:hypothetical protein